MDERRRFTRVLFSTLAKVTCHNTTWESRIIDLSLNGALLTLPDEFKGQLNDTCQLSFSLFSDDIDVLMDCHITHIEHHHDKDRAYIGLQCDQVDLDSVSHLKRIIELNTGDEGLLHRELEQLSHLD